MKITNIFAILLFLTLSSTVAAKNSHHVKGHVKKSGTYVAPHRATNQDKTQTNNYSTKGNTNPYTGKKGTKTAKK
jgi:uncharacterized membrane protein YdfJ with MMPL/SSD domain